MAGSSSSYLLKTIAGNKMSLTSRSLTGIGNLIKLLPTGTVFLFQFLNPILTNNGKCHLINKYLAGALIAICGLSCFFSCFTNSYRDGKGLLHYGFATLKGLWPFNYSIGQCRILIRVFFGKKINEVYSDFGVKGLLSSLTVRSKMLYVESGSLEVNSPYKSFIDKSLWPNYPMSTSYELAKHEWEKHSPLFPFLTQYEYFVTLELVESILCDPRSEHYLGRIIWPRGKLANTISAEYVYDVIRDHFGYGFQVCSKRNGCGQKCFNHLMLSMRRTGYSYDVLKAFGFSPCVSSDTLLC